jgi:predicted DNA-binding protein (MmcQ/YjbR family)
MSGLRGLPAARKTEAPNAASLIEYCLKKPGAYPDYPFGETPLCVKVRGKIFAEIYLQEPLRITLKCDPMLADFYRRQYPGAVLPGYHVPNAQKIYRNTVYVNEVPQEELLRMIDHSYEEVVKKLTKKAREDLLGEQRNPSDGF